MRRLTLGLFLSILVVSVLIVGACAPKPTSTPTPTPTPTPKPTPTESVADFYKKNTVTFFVSESPGTGPDYAARVVSSFWADTAGGNAKVTNKAGGSAIPGNNQVYSVEKPDGLTIAVTQIGNMIIAVTGKVSGVEYDLNKINWIALLSPGAPHAIVVSPKSSYTSLADLQKAKGLKFAGNGPSGVYTASGAIAIKILKLDAKIILGYKSPPEMALALGRGEVDAMTLSPSDIEKFSASGLLGPRVVQLAYERSPAWKDVPIAGEVANLSAEDKKFLDIHTTRLSGVVVWVRPEVSQDKVEFLRNTIIKVATSPEATTLLAKDVTPLLPPVTGDNAAKKIAALLAQPSESMQQIVLFISQIGQ